MNATLQMRNRVQSIDIVRGLVMVIMALDHVRDFFHESAMVADPTNLDTTTPALFFTRWITHFCAPVFVFLAGTSAYLSGQKRSKKELSSFLLKRGLWLIFAETVIVTFALSFNPFYNIIFLQVIWVTGWSMIILALLVHLPLQWVAVIGLVLFLGHNVFDHITLPQQGIGSVLLRILITTPANFFPLTPGLTIAVLYKILPWTAVMVLGYVFGYLFRQGVDAERRRRSVYITGFAFILLFILLRAINVYGDPSLWSVQRSTLYTFFSFINTTKYPPSLLYLCMTLGPAIILLGLVEHWRSKATSFFITFGSVPFFYYIIHFYMVHSMCVVAFYLAGYHNSQVSDPNSPFLFRPAAFGFNLAVVYIIWILVLVMMYPLCRWYSKYKRSQQQWWLSYL